MPAELVSEPDLARQSAAGSCIRSARSLRAAKGGGLWAGGQSRRPGEQCKPISKEGGGKAKRRFPQTADRDMLVAILGVWEGDRSPY